jgi:hypothetical protein
MCFEANAIMLYNLPPPAVFVSNPEQLTAQQQIQQRQYIMRALQLRNPTTTPEVLLGEANQLMQRMPLMHKLGLLP